MDKIKVVVVDDEQFARQSIITILVSKFNNIDVVGEAESVKDAVDIIKGKKPDLVFLDIDLTDGSGFDVVNFLKPISFQIIFVTAHQEYAIKAIKFSALDYILKPVSSFELEAAVNRLLEDRTSENQQFKLDAFTHNMQETSTDKKKIVLKTSDSIHIIKVIDIRRCEADNNYTTFYIANGERIIVSKGLKEYDELLSGYGFFRVHQSHLINLSCISRFDKKDGGSLVLCDEAKIPVSQRKKQKLLDIFEKFNS